MKTYREEEQKTGNSHTNKRQADRAINREEDSQMKNRQPDIDKMIKDRDTKHKSRKKHTQKKTHTQGNTKTDGKRNKIEEKQGHEVRNLKT